MKFGSPKRVILFLIDGLHFKALGHLEMPVFRGLIPQGTYAPESWMILPHHPTVGSYSQFHTTSYPNPVLMSGNLFLSADNRFVQEAVNQVGRSGFFVNARAYRSVIRGFSEIMQEPDATDAQVVEATMSALGREDFAFLRVHLQTAGNLGYECAGAPADKPYRRNIWGEGSPYADALARADALLGKFITFLKDEGKWDDTVFIFSSDHGQSELGWHPIADPDSWRTPLLFTGPGITKGRQLVYAEHTDLAPTITWLLGVEAPNPGPGCGTPITSILAGEPDTSDTHPRIIARVNRQNIEYLRCRALLQLATARDFTYSSRLTLLENQFLTPEPFYGIDRIFEWHHAGSAEHLLEANERVLTTIRAAARAAAELLELKPEQVPWLKDKR